MKRLRVAAVEKSTGETLQVYSFHTNDEGDVTHISLERNKVNTTWEPVENFELLPFQVRITNNSQEDE